MPTLHWPVETDSAQRCTTCPSHRPQAWQSAWPAGRKKVDCWPSHSLGSILAALFNGLPQVYRHLRFDPQAPPVLGAPATSVGLYTSTNPSRLRNALTSAALKPFTNCDVSSWVVVSGVPFLPPALLLLCAQALFVCSVRPPSCRGGCVGALV